MLERRFYRPTVFLTRLSFTHLLIHPSGHSCFNLSIYHLSNRLSAGAQTHPPIHPPIKSRQVLQWTHYLPTMKKKKTLLVSDRRLVAQKQIVVTQCPCWSVGKTIGGNEEDGRGGSKCQVPLGSEDGGNIYQSIQPRGAEYFPCRCGLLHYHIHQSRRVPLRPLAIQNSCNMQKGWCYEMLNCDRAGILKEIYYLVAACERA